MREKFKTKELPPLCAAVKRLREAYSQSQEAFAANLGISAASISRFELGKAVPADQTVLYKLYDAASRKQLSEEAEQFLRALGGRQVAHLIRTSTLFEDRMVPAHRSLTVRQWRYSAALDLLMSYYPENIGALEKALAPALHIVDSVLRGCQGMEGIEYSELDRRVIQMADEQTLQKIQQHKTGESS